MEPTHVAVCDPLQAQAGVEEPGGDDPWVVGQLCPGSVQGRNLQ